MNRTLIILTTILLTALPAWSSRAFREPITLSQPDGTQLTVWLHGDENHHWMTTADGTMVVNTQKGCFVASINEDGELAPTTVLAHEPILRTAAEQRLAARQTEPLRTLFHKRGSQAEGSARRAQVVEGNRYLPHTGSPRVLVILTAYQDLDFTIPDPVKSFTQYLNSETLEDYENKEGFNDHSVRKYFDISSGGQFTPQFDVVGPVTLPDSMKYYGGSSAYANDENISKLGEDAINLVKDKIDLKDYDNDGDGRVELVYIIHAGYGQNAGGPAESMWAKVAYVNRKIGDTYVNNFGCNAELFSPSGLKDNEGFPYAKYINGTGTFCHEFSHAMGLPDLYPNTTASRRVDNQTLEHWSIMDYGLYRRNGFAPTPYNAWERSVMGWEQPKELTETTKGITLLPFAEGGKSYKIANSKKSEEVFLIENIQKRGVNARAFGHGMLVYHIDYASNTVNMGDYPNNTAGHPRVTVVPADGLLISGYQTLRSDGSSQGYGGTHTQAEYSASLAGDPFPGTGGITEVSDHLSVPNYMYYHGNGTTGVALKNIAEDTEAGTVTFDFVTIAKGDINADEQIDAADVVAITNIITGKDTNSNTARADVNGDSKVDISDIVNTVGLAGTEVQVP